MVQKSSGARLSAALVATLWLAAPAAAASKEDDDALKKEIEALKTSQQQVLKELGEIKQLLQKQATAQAQARPPAPPPPNVKGMVLDLGKNPTVGSPAAKVTLVEFTDYQCPYCSQYARDTYKQIKSQYIDTGKVRYTVMDQPLDFHKLAFKAAEATHCAGDQGKFWEMHDRLFEQQRTLEPWTAHAEAVGIDVAKFTACLDGGQHAEAIRKDMAEGQKVGARGTPSFFLAETNAQDPTKVTGISLLPGAAPFDRFKTDIEQALAVTAK
jgi:protein-disulfide isomerase